MKTRVGVALAAGLVVVAGCGASGLETGGGTVEKKTASAFLTTTEADWHKQVDAESNKNIDPSARCYFVTGADGKQSLGTLACGPLRRLGTPERQVWDVLAIQTTGGDKPGFEPADSDQWQKSQLRPDNSAFWRPDDKKADDNADALAAPAAPAAQAGLTTVSDKSEKLELKPATGKIVVPDGTLTLKGLATPETVGSGTEVKAPASGEKFVVAVFGTTPTLDPLDGASAVNAATAKSALTKWTVTVGDEQRPVEVLPGVGSEASAAERTLLVSVPKDTSDLTLTATNGGVVQKLSLTTGERTTTDVAAAYYRTGVSVDLGKSFPPTVRNVGEYYKSTYFLSLKKAALAPWDPDHGWAPAGKAWFRLQIDSKLDYNYILYKTTWVAPFLKLTADGVAIPPVPDTMDVDVIAIPVPATTKVVQLTANSVLSFAATDPGATPASGRVTFPVLTATATFQ
ncbi:hypothetical protein OHA70_14940 [Kribbella sp. NBC_00382]|uniref:hypothetical protein n=1 Tax=Kribbella sp. NBC_00382 TaxID=2975967 RepID=UPI002E21333B